MHKKYFILIALLAGIPVAAQENGSETATERIQKFAVVQPSKIFVEGDGGSLEWKDRTESLRADVMERGQRIQAEMQRLQQLRTELQNPDQGKSKWSTPESREEKIREAAVLERSIEVAYKTASEYEMQKMQEIQNDLVRKLDRVIADIAKEKGYDAVFPNAIYASPSVDITPIVIERLNKEYQAKKKSDSAKKKSSADKKAVAAA